MADHHGDERLPTVNFEDAGPQTRLLERRRQMYDASTALEKAKADFAAREEELRVREAAKDAVDADFRQSMLLSAAALAENESKTQRAEKRVVDERRGIELKIGEISEGKRDLSAAEGDLRVLNTAKGKLQAYHDYLASYQSENSQEFVEIGTILERYHTLRHAQTDLIEETDRLQDELEHKRGEVSRASKVRATAVLNADNVLTGLRERIELARAEVLALQTGAESAVARHARRTLELGQVLQSVSNILGRCTRSRFGAAIKHSPMDAEVLGRPIPDFSAELGLPPLHRDDDDGPSGGLGPSGLGEDSLMACVGPGMEEEEWLADTIVAARAGLGAAEMAAGASHSSPVRTPRKGKQAPVILAVASPRKRNTQDNLGAGGEGDADESSVRKGKAVDITGMEPSLIRDKARVALGQLYVVGAYIVDLTAMIKEYPAWQAEKRRKERETAEAAAAEMSLTSRSVAKPASTALVKGGGQGVTTPSKAPGNSSANLSQSVPYSPMTVPVGKSKGAATSLGSGLGSMAARSGAGVMSSMAPGVSTWAAGALGGAGSAQADRVAAVLHRQGHKVYSVSPSVHLPAPTAPVSLPLDRSGQGNGHAGGSGSSAVHMKGSLKGSAQHMDGHKTGPRSPAK